MEEISTTILSATNSLLTLGATHGKFHGTRSCILPLGPIHSFTKQIASSFKFSFIESAAADVLVLGNGALTAVKCIDTLMHS